MDKFNDWYVFDEIKILFWIYFYFKYNRVYCQYFINSVFIFWYFVN